ncbi:MAG TPA: S-methyl-5-thioribose-1-phosphate isomerase [Clostridiales bacterium]|nr:S-methyl-5-thioribose-1-phosphate isomerase [Clostridiales bacterium]
MTGPGQKLKAVALDDEKNELLLLDQTLLPGECRILHLKTTEEIHEAIQSLRVRGAPAIGVAAAYGVYLAAAATVDAATAAAATVAAATVAATTTAAVDREDFRRRLLEAARFLATSRPTAVNLFWALDRMTDCLERSLSHGLQLPAVKAALKDAADAIRDEDEAVNRSIGENALALLKPGMGLLTHCNAGQLATTRYGTALAPMLLGQERGYGFKVFADETRPLLQGARLTAYELMAAGVDVTLICDNMASIVMKNGWVQAVLVGCDRVAANGDTANKIGTSGVAILAKHYQIPFYVCAPTSTLDFGCATGADIPIELRRPEEVTDLWYRQRMAPEGVGVYNPAFDVTDAALITGIITEFGAVQPPYGESLATVRRQMEQRRSFPPHG